jgi:hypothetical protein
MVKLITISAHDRLTLLLFDNHDRGHTKAPSDTAGGGGGEE